MFRKIARTISLALTLTILAICITAVVRTFSAFGKAILASAR